MSSPKTYFFCGIGGSGMMPLAALMHKSGEHVLGSDRSHDQMMMPEKFKALEDLGIKLVPQDGHHLGAHVDRMVVSSAVEPSIPDVKAALDHGVEIVTRGALLAEFFNAEDTRIAVAGTSGKSTVTGMIGTMLLEMDLDPTVVNGGEIRNFRVAEIDKFSGVRKGQGNIFVAEMDESDGSIAHYHPSYAVLNNIALDHKTMEELEQLFGAYVDCAEKAVIANYDHERVRRLCERHKPEHILWYGIEADGVSLCARDLRPRVDGVDFTLEYNGLSYSVALSVPGRHNVENALAALSICAVMDLDMAQGIKALSAFKGIHRRMELIGTQGGVTVYDDFGHNPDKIAASLETLKAFPGRLIVMFQPHGFGPLRMMGKEMVEAFAKYLDDDDILIMPEVYYAGGTVDRSVTAHTIIEMARDRGVCAYWFETRDEMAGFLEDIGQNGDRIVIMGARDDTLHHFAHEVLAHYE